MKAGDQIRTETDSRQQLVELLGLSYFLKERSRYLSRKPDGQENNNPDEEKELRQIQDLLEPAQIDSLNMDLSGMKFPSNEAGTRLKKLIKTGATLTLADLVHIEAIAEFPESGSGFSTRRMVFLSALSKAALASSEELEELHLLTRFPPAANA